MSKLVDISLEFTLPKDAGLCNVKITHQGEFILSNKDGNPIIPESMSRKVSYQRESKSPKVQTYHPTYFESLSFSGYMELTEYENIFAIDTNNPENNSKTFISAFICTKLAKTDEGFELICPDGKVHFYEFHNVNDNDSVELLAIWKLIKDIKGSSGAVSGKKFLIITDTELGMLSDINSKKIPLFKVRNIESEFTLAYASADTGASVINKLIRFCDRQASIHYSLLKKGELPKKDARLLEEEKSVQFRYMSRNDFKIVNPIINPQGLPDGAEFTLYGKKNKDD